MRWWCFGAALLSVSVVSRAEEWLTPPPIASPITDHLALRGDYFFGTVSTSAREDSSAGVAGTRICAECLLGLTDQAHQGRMEIIFRLEDRSRLRVDFLDLRRQGDSFLNQTLKFGDQSFAVHSTVQSELDWRQMDLTYTYSFLKGERYELGAGVGIHLLEVDAIVQYPGTPQRAEFSGAVPFATLALDGTWRIANRWSLNARGQYFKVTVNEVGGILGDYHGDVQYRWQRNVAFGAGYERQDVQNAQLKLKNQDPSGFVKMRISGPELFVRVSY
jgi:hypothetical protein